MSGQRINMLMTKPLVHLYIGREEKRRDCLKHIIICVPVGFSSSENSPPGFPAEVLSGFSLYPGG